MSVFDSASEPMLVLDGGGRILLFNNACERVGHLSAAGVIGEHVKLLMRPGVAEASGGDVEALFRDLEAGADACFQDGTGRGLALVPCLSTVTDGAGVKHLVILRHASRRSADARMPARERFCAAVVHQLNQPLTALGLYLRAIERAYGQATGGAVLPDQVISILRKSIGEVERAGGMLQDLRQPLVQGEGTGGSAQANGASRIQAPDDLPGSPDDRRARGGARSRPVAQETGGDTVTDSREREWFTPPLVPPARVPLSPSQEEKTWVNV